MSKKLTNEEFIKNSELIHPGKFCYEKVEYKSRRQPVILICQLCRYEWYITPNDLLRVDRGLICCPNSKEHYKFLNENYYSIDEVSDKLEMNRTGLYRWFERLNFEPKKIDGRKVISENEFRKILEFRKEYLEKSKKLNIRFRRKKFISDACVICHKQHQYTGFIYKWTNKINGKWYIGSHDGCEEDGYIGSSLFLSRAIEKHGIDNFNREILFFCTEDRMTLYAVETEILEGFDARNDKMSYNMKNVGVGADPKVVSERFRGKKIPREIVEKQRKSLIESGKVAGVNNARAQKVICLDTKEVFDYGRLAANAVEGTEAGISEACNKGYKHRGKHWMFYDEYLELGEPEENPRYTNSEKAKWRVVRLSDGKIFETALGAAKYHKKPSFNYEAITSTENTFAGHYWMKYPEWVKAGYPLRVPPLIHFNTIDRVVDLVTGIIYPSAVACGNATEYNENTVRKHCSGESNVRRFMYEKDWEISEKKLIKDPGKKNIPVPVVNLTKNITFKTIKEAAKYEKIHENTFRIKLKKNELINGNEYRRQNEPEWSLKMKSYVQLSFEIE